MAGTWKPRGSSSATTLPGEITDFGQNAGYGTLLQQDYTKTGGGTNTLYTDFRNIMSPNPCPQG
jgi:hypothetical protein